MNISGQKFNIKLLIPVAEGMNEIWLRCDNVSSSLGLATSSPFVHRPAQVLFFKKQIENPLNLSDLSVPSVLQVTCEFGAENQPWLCHVVFGHTLVGFLPVFVYVGSQS